MSGMKERRTARFELVTAAQHFLAAVVPLRDPESTDALVSFAEAAEVCTLPRADTEAVLLRCLALLDRHTGGRLPSLVDTYLARGRGLADAVQRFRRCVEEVLRHRGVRHASVQRAIEIIGDCYRDSKISQPSIAARVGLEPSAFSAKFSAETGLTFSAYLRNLRLDRAAALLATTDKSVKEVWAEVGYNHPSNFDHDFKRRFGVAPREYRARNVRPAALTKYPQVPVPAPSPRAESPPDARGTVLIVEDDEGTRDTVGRYLTLEGYRVFVASTGEEGLVKAGTVAPHTMVLDYHLPDVDGLECVRRLRARSPGPTPAVLLFTADWELEVGADELRSLGTTVVPKPCDVEDLERLIWSTTALTPDL